MVVSCRSNHGDWNYRAQSIPHAYITLRSSVYLNEKTGLPAQSPCRRHLRGIREAVIRLPPDVLRVIEKAAAAETSPVARGEFENILKNIEIAERLGVPMCQDTGVPVIYLTLPPDVPLTQDLYDAVAEGVRRATKEVPLRPNVVDPLTRHNTGDNTGAGMPAIHVKPGKKFTVTVLPKGAGAENMSRIAMLLPSQKDQIEKFVVETVLPCRFPPLPPGHHRCRDWRDI